MRILTSLLFATFIFNLPVSAGLTYVNGQFCESDDVAMADEETHWKYACEAYANRDWKHAVRHFNIYAKNFPDSWRGQEAYFYLGVSHFYKKEYEFANNAFTEYLNRFASPEHLEDAIEYKFYIAEAFRAGAKRHGYGSKYLPAILSAKELSLDVYDEIILAFPSHDLAAKSIYAKSQFHWENKEYLQAVDSCQTLIRRFPRHELAPESYVMIGQIYLSQADRERQNADILAFSELNFKRFQEDFPTEERLDVAQANVLKVKECYARGLFEAGEFYERISKPEASKLYYKNAIENYPETNYARKCVDKLQGFGEEVTIHYPGE